ncbi:hypothetical protein BJ085DRAFT_27812 [Dimargaris cristalligena]|uniref:Uncharacterized protein n=1 Tax=Dimargaris cristalligena TaxID=215637 RepID=A0A4Q0A2L9_9FUNG|nr:hypothetical protein BJ085DRAFT_27812 [Dimargaris cristalligena]|eukprot:RKP39771.1 hypothetical protein BJ085DRAFT_27812 [Dimargaris cristalligena]
MTNDGELNCKNEYEDEADGYVVADGVEQRINKSSSNNNNGSSSSGNSRGRSRAAIPIFLHPAVDLSLCGFRLSHLPSHTPESACNPASLAVGVKLPYSTYTYTRTHIYPTTTPPPPPRLSPLVLYCARSVMDPLLESHCKSEGYCVIVMDDSKGGVIQAVSFGALHLRPETTLSKRQTTPSNEGE